MNELYHHGIKGQRWGVRRYQNKDGSLTEEGMYRRRAMNAARTKESVDRIYRSMPAKDKHFIGDDDPNVKEFLTKEQGEFVVKRFLDKHGDTPVAWLDIMTSTKRGELVAAVGTDPNYRGQGRAYKLAQKGRAWFDKNADRLGAKYLSWDAYNDNVASRRVAEKAGFKYNKKKSNDEWAVYEYRKR